ncbi:MAG: MarR family transcriptional regulator [Ruminococcaceae bacterium]|nr:MarR family transcriptional regulator [Oscillospiraceae bacterium]
MSEERLHFKLFKCFQKSHFKLMQEASLLGLSSGQPKILEYLYANDASLCSEIAAECALDKSTVAGLIARMEKSGLVRRKRCSNDGRCIYVHLTKLGREKAAAVLDISNDVDMLAMHGMSEGEKAVLSELLGRVCNNLSSNTRYNIKKYLSEEDIKMNRKVKTMVKGMPAIDGAGVHLVRVLGNRTVREFDPILMLDSFDSTNPADYTAGFPMHPHRGIETISYLYRGKMQHRDSLGNSDTISDGEVQWMNSGSGIMHEEAVPAVDRLLGVQLWINLPSKEKMSKPTYHSVKRDEIPEIPFEGGMLRLLAGNYLEHEGYKGEHLPLNYYDIHINENSEIVIDTQHDDSVMLFTLLGNITVDGTDVPEKTAVKLTDGDRVSIKTKDSSAEVLFMGSRALKEPVVWAGPIVMNTNEEVNMAYNDLRTGKFIREHVDY